MMKVVGVLCTVLLAGTALAQTKEEPRLQCPRGTGGIGVCVFNPDINCSGDDKCTNGQICCPDGCNRICKHGVPAPKPVSPPSEGKGRCPPTTPTFGACVFNPEVNCVDDEACNNGKMCCPDGCNKICKAPAPELPPPVEDPSKMIKKGSEGRCPPTTPTFGACVFNPEVNCVDDEACNNGKICCPDGCNKICKAPAPELPPLMETQETKEQSGGKCPPATPTFGACVFNPEVNCKDDDACNNGQVCCPSGCNKVCVNPLPTPVHYASKP